MKFLLMDINLIYFLLILFFIINLAFAYRMKNFSLSKRNINLFNLLFLFTTLSHYLVNTDYHGMRLEMILELQILSAFFSKIIYVFVIHPYLNALVIVLFILSIMLIINRLLNFGSNYFFDDWSKPIKISILISFSLYWIPYTLINLIKYGVR